MDVFILGGTRLDGDPPGATNRLYKNNRDGTFTDVTAKAGLVAAGWASGVCVGDYNNDGFEDLFCTSFGQNRLYRNNGDGTFTDVTKAAGLWNAEPRWGAGCSFVDYDRDGHLDLFVSNYIRFSVERAPVPGANSNCNWKGIPVACGPRGLPHGRHFALSEQRRRHVHRRERAGGHRRRDAGLWHDRRGRRPRRGRLARHLRGVRLDAQPALHEQPRRDVPRGRRAARRRAQRGWRRAGRHGRRHRRLRPRRPSRSPEDALLRTTRAGCITTTGPGSSTT